MGGYTFTIEFVATEAHACPRNWGVLTTALDAGHLHDADGVPWRDALAGAKIQLARRS